MEKNNTGTIKLSKSQFETLLESTIKQVLSEISWGVAHDAAKKSDNRVEMLENALDAFRDGVEKMMYALEGIDDSGYAQDDIQPTGTQGALLAGELWKIKYQIENYIARKIKQNTSLNQNEKNKWSKAFGNRNFDQVADDVDKKWDEYMNGDSMQTWKQYKKSHLSQDEQDFNDRY